MMQTLKSLLRDNLSIFVPYTMRYKYPEGFEKAIKYQTRQIINNSTIVLQNINESSMYYMDTYIKAMKGVKDLLPANNVEHSGRYNILVDKDDFAQIRNKLLTSIPEWYNQHVPSDALPPEGKFPGPPRVKQIIRDSESSGENSWVSRSSASFMSMDLSTIQNDDYFSSSLAATKTFTYASAVTRENTTLHGKSTFQHIADDENKEVISDITGARTENDIEAYKLEIDQLVERQKQERAESEAIMATQKAEIQRLTEAYQRANIAYEEVTAELRQQRTHVTTLIAEQLSIADKKRNEDMKAMRHEMMKAMKEMLQNTQHNNVQFTGYNSSQTKRVQHGDESPTEDEEGSENRRREKRPDRRKTPTKKLILVEVHLAEGLIMTQPQSHRKMECDEASSGSE